MFKKFKDTLGIIIVAVIAATLVRQMVFEMYEIPTGSMRPTFKEQDDVVVSKTVMGINMPLSTDHFYFDPSLTRRTGIFIFSGDNIDLPDTDSHYLWIFPYKKRYIKRCMGKPGDYVYFYGGKLYGIDSEGSPLRELSESSYLSKIPYVPYIYLDGILSKGQKNTFYFSQMNQKIGRLELSAFGQGLGEIFNGKDWIKDDVTALNTPHDSIKTYSDFWGFKNYALSRILTKNELREQEDLKPFHDMNGKLFLELRHTPHLNSKDPLFQKGPQGIMPVIGAFTSVIALNDKQLEALMDNMYTARFVVKNEKAFRYSFDSQKIPTGAIEFPSIPDGTYEFYYGIAYEIGMGSMAYELPKTHPLYSKDPKHIQKLYNFGIEFNKVFTPTPKNLVTYPSRYTYFREGDLYTLGGIIFEKQDPELISFNKKELEREKEGFYSAFKDYGPPLDKEGKVDVTFMKTFGLKIPDKHYLALGDNHAMSADSRIFGFVPQANIQGAPGFLIWPPGNRFGSIPQASYNWFAFPTQVVWGILGLIFAIWYAFYIRREFFLKK